MALRPQSTLNRLATSRRLEGVSLLQFFQFLLFHSKFFHAILSAAENERGRIRATSIRRQKQREKKDHFFNPRPRATTEFRILIFFSTSSHHIDDRRLSPSLRTHHHHHDKIPSQLDTHPLHRVTENSKARHTVTKCASLSLHHISF